MKKCSCCKNLRDNQDYINKFGKETKTCLKCRERNTERNLNIRKAVEPIIEPVEPITETKVETEPKIIIYYSRSWLLIPSSSFGSWGRKTLFKFLFLNYRQVSRQGSPQIFYLLTFCCFHNWLWLLLRLNLIQILVRLFRCQS